MKNSSTKLKDERRHISLENGEQALASFPLIVSASRSTDIPAFYADWFFDRLKKGYSVWINPFNGKKYYVGYEDVKFIVFWSKNPKPLLAHLGYLEERGIGCYIQYTLNDYEKDGLERGLPPLKRRIETFKALADLLGKGSVIWRFDPLLLTASIGVNDLLSRIRDIGRQVHEHTEKLVFSFADILPYRMVKANLEKNHILHKDWTRGQMLEFAQKLMELNKLEGWDLELATCGEAQDLPGIQHNRCIDDRLILRLANRSPELLNYLGAREIEIGDDLDENALADAIRARDGRYVSILKHKLDRGQREACGCVKSKDIGQYNTCMHLCEYCYANAGKEIVRQNHARHMARPAGETIS